MTFFTSAFVPQQQAFRRLREQDRQRFRRRRPAVLLPLGLRVLLCGQKSFQISLRYEVTLDGGMRDIYEGGVTFQGATQEVSERLRLMGCDYLIDEQRLLIARRQFLA